MKILHVTLKLDISGLSFDMQYYISASQTYVPPHLRLMAVCDGVAQFSAASQFSVCRKKGSNNV